MVSWDNSVRSQGVESAADLRVAEFVSPIAEKRISTGGKLEFVICGFAAAVACREKLPLVHSADIDPFRSS